VIFLHLKTISVLIPVHFWWNSFNFSSVSVFAEAIILLQIQFQFSK